MVYQVQNRQSYLPTALREVRREVDDLNRQLSSGERIEGFVDLAHDRDVWMAMKQQIAKSEAYASNADRVQIRYNMITTSLTTVGNIFDDSKGAMLSDKLTAGTSGSTPSQKSSRDDLSSVIDALNVDAAGRYLFSGRRTDESPLQSMNIMMEGQGTRAGFEEVLEERWRADKGSSGLGRLTVSESAGVVQLSEDVADHPFGFKIAGVSASSSSPGISGPLTPENGYDIDFSLLNPEEGESITIRLRTEAGEETTLTLTAKAEDSDEAGAFTLDSQDPAVTAASFMEALEAEIKRAVGTTLKEASARAAADQFFFSAEQGIPLRVEQPVTGDPVSLRQADPDDTIFWYKGDPATDDPRRSVSTNVSALTSAHYGVRANEEPFVEGIKALAVFSAIDFDSDNELDQEVHTSLKNSLANQLGNANDSQGLDSIEKELTLVGLALKRGEESNHRATSMAEGILSDVQNVDRTETAVRLNSLLDQIEAGYTVNQRLRSLSLLNYL